MWRKIGWLVLFLSAMAVTAYAAVPGKHRIITPRLYGLTEIAPKIWVDETNRALEIITLVKLGKKNSAQFFEKNLSEPTYIICTQPICAVRFGMTTRGFVLGDKYVLIGPKGINEMIMTHEQIHADLHSYLGVSDVLEPRYPMWFNEGLATHLSKDDRLNRPKHVKDALWIKEAMTFRDWGRMTNASNWRDTYGAAARLVEALENQIGIEGLQEIVHRVGAGEDFDIVLMDIAQSIPAFAH